MIEPWWRKFAPESGEIGREVTLDGGRKALISARLVRRSSHRLRQFGIDHRPGNGLLRIECRQTAREVLKLADVSRPAIAPEPVERGLIELLDRQAPALRPVRI